jgi:hypothetical protein
MVLVSNGYGVCCCYSAHPPVHSNAATMVSQWCCKGVTVVLQWCRSCVASALHLCFSSVSGGVTVIGLPVG